VSEIFFGFINNVHSIIVNLMHVTEEQGDRKCDLYPGLHDEANVKQTSSKHHANMKHA